MPSDLSPPPTTGGIEEPPQPRTAWPMVFGILMIINASMSGVGSLLYVSAPLTFPPMLRWAKSTMPPAEYADVEASFGHITQFFVLGIVG
ncbi:MAG TPA: hypothetical protein VG711_00895, partial [Phycisphaerales bacterium]|nr:hypothetical protein [Phycisphaerales bacterium]